MAVIKMEKFIILEEDNKLENKIKEETQTTLKRQRSENWNDADKELLKDLVKKRFKIIENKNTDTNTNQAKKKAWQDIEKDFNSWCTSKYRTVTQLKSQWTSIKINAKKEVSDFRLKSQQTGGGHGPPEVALSGDDIAVWHPNEFVIDTNEFDSDVAFLKDGAESVADCNTEDEAISTVEPPCSSQSIKVKAEPKCSFAKKSDLREKQDRYRKTNVLDETILKNAHTDMEYRHKIHLLQVEVEMKRIRNLDLEYELIEAKFDSYKKNMCDNHALKEEIKQTTDTLLHINTDKEISKKEVDVSIKKKTIKILTEWCIENCRPFRIVGDSGFEKVGQHLVSVGAQYGPNVDLKNLFPHATTISRNISKVYESYFEKIKSEITEIKNVGFGITSDLWTDNFLRKTYICLTVHYIKDAKLINRLLGMRSMEGEKCTYENIRLKVIKLLNEFDLDLNDCAIIVTDRGSNMVAAFRTNNHIYSVYHLLQNAVQKSIEDVSEVAELSRLCSKLVKYFKISGLNAKLSSILKSFSPTRWNSIYNLFLSFEENWSDIIQLLQQKNELNRINNISIINITALVNLLKTFEDTFNKLEGENYPTMHLVYIYIYRSKKKCAADNSDIEIIKRFKEKLLYYLENDVLNNLTIFHKIGLFLFPPLNKMVKFSEDEQTEIRNECKRTMRMFLEEDVEPQSESGGTSAVSNKNIELISDFLPHAQFNNMDVVETEIFKYETLTINFYDDFNILQWWEANKQQFPLLHKLSCKILGTPASSVASERVFSAARNLITEKRCSIASNDDTVNETMFLHYNIPKDELETEISAQTD